MRSLTFIFFIMKFKSFRPLLKCDIFGIGSAISTSGAIATTAMNNATNKSIADSVNATNRENVKATNEANIQMNTANNDLQRQLQAEMNEYNSIGSQLERGAQAGVNPNAILGGVSGNLQTTLPSTNAGHADAPLAQIGHPMENPIAPAIDAFSKYMDARLTKAQAENQETINEFQKELSSLDVQVKKADAKKLLADADYVVQQNEESKSRCKEIEGKISLMSEQQRQVFLDNYFREDEYNSFLNNMRTYLKRAGIPDSEQLSDDDIKMYYYGALQRVDMPLEDLQLKKIEENEKRANINLMQTTSALNNARSAKEVAETAIINEFGAEEAKANIRATNMSAEESKAGANLKRAERHRTIQEFKANNFRTSKTYQGYMIQEKALNNLQIKANTRYTHYKSSQIQQGEIGRRVGTIYTTHQ